MGARKNTKGNGRTVWGDSGDGRVGGSKDRTRLGRFQTGSQNAGRDVNIPSRQLRRRGSGCYEIQRVLGRCYGVGGDRVGRETRARCGGAGRGQLGQGGEHLGRGQPGKEPRSRRRSLSPPDPVPRPRLPASVPDLSPRQIFPQHLGEIPFRARSFPVQLSFCSRAHLASVLPQRGGHSTAPGSASAVPALCDHTTQHLTQCGPLRAKSLRVMS